MADRFFDTSAAVKHYRAELGTDQVDAFLAETGSRHFLSLLSVVEFHSVFARLIRIGHLTKMDFDSIRSRFLADVAAGLWQVAPVTTVHFYHARELLIQYGTGYNLRTLDALQFTVARDLNIVISLDAFICADVNLCRIAQAEGLMVVNPETT